MEYSKLLFVLFLFIALINAIPVPSFEQEPQDISIDANVDVDSKIDDISNDVLSSISYSVKSSIEKDLGSKPNDSSTNGMVNKVVVDLLSKTSDKIKSAISGILKKDIQHIDFQTIANKAAGKVNEVLGNDVLVDIASNIKNVDYKNVANNVLSNTADSVQDFIKKSLDAGKSIVNQLSDEVSISDTTGISEMVTNGVSFLIKRTLCESLDDNIKENCNNLSKGIIVSSVEILNKIISSNIKAASGNSISVACSVIPSEVFEKLPSVISNAVSTISGSANDNDVNKITNTILTVIINSIESLLCSEKHNTNENGIVLLNDIGSLANNIIRKVNGINNDIVLTLNDKKGKENNISSSIASIISDIQNTIKDKVEAEQPVDEKVTVEAEQPVDEQVTIEAEEPVTAEIQQPVTAEAEQPVDEQVTIEAEQPVDEQVTIEAEQPVDEQVTAEIEQPVDEQVTVEAEEPVTIEA